jgi:hypothetical protein
MNMAMTVLRAVMLFLSAFLLGLAWGKQKFRVNDTTKIVLKTVVHDGVDWIDLAQDRCKWRDIVKKCVKFLSSVQGK